jgi:hypothetical protein
MAKVELYEYNAQGQKIVRDLKADRGLIVKHISHVSNQRDYGQTYEEGELATMSAKIDKLESLMVSVLTAMNTPLFRRTLEDLGHNIIDEDKQPGGDQNGD